MGDAVVIASLPDADAQLSSIPTDQKCKGFINQLKKMERISNTNPGR